MYVFVFTFLTYNDSPLTALVCETSTFRAKLEILINAVLLNASATLHFLDRSSHVFFDRWFA
ncbi:hypothetical protein AZE42_11849 [Rhizopogon vesiculosus]|uniref:Uncharacterized protein n=1 Tax=Rhizopogon vesiculosus TaxID=180088 RepID=A0A1J8RBR6_9AGAM|nr:hypothetical protein AZE42_11849 [Rhizopogon vesiculosus]